MCQQIVNVYLCLTLTGFQSKLKPKFPPWSQFHQILNEHLNIFSQSKAFFNTKPKYWSVLKVYLFCCNHNYVI